ncbi:MAG: hypothetical protein D6813_03530 [Calditrichaeota bacterium]|nr:MAG: hypothetical protein D6813_03530 [Calditrichota bacterium]
MKNINKNKLLKIPSLILLFAIFQFFVPLINTARADKCCSANDMQCCQAVFPARMVCCIGNAKPGFNESAPTQGILIKPQKLLQGLFIYSPSSVFNLTCSVLGLKENFPIQSFIKENNKIFKKLSVFLI